MYVCMHACMYVCMYKYTHTNIYANRYESIVKLWGRKAQQWDTVNDSIHLDGCSYIEVMLSRWCFDHERSI